MEKVEKVLARILVRLEVETVVQTEETRYLRILFTELRRIFRKDKSAQNEHTKGESEQRLQIHCTEERGWRERKRAEGKER